WNMGTRRNWIEAAVLASDVQRQTSDLPNKGPPHAPLAAIHSNPHSSGPGSGLRHLRWRVCLVPLHGCYTLRAAGWIGGARPPAPRYPVDAAAYRALGDADPAGYAGAH